MVQSSQPMRGTTEAGSSTGSFNYLDPSVEPSLYRNGRVLVRRDRDGSDDGAEGLLIERRSVPVDDARELAPDAACTLARNGFEFHTRPLLDPDLDFLQHEPVVRQYYNECADLIREVTGATHVTAFDHNVRSAQGKKSQTRISGGQQVQPPAHMVHGDYTLTSAPQRMRDLAAPPTGNDTLRRFLPEDEALIDPRLVEQALSSTGRFAIINAWRNISPTPVAAHPLALCDAQTVVPGDLVVFEIHYPDRVGENYFARYAPRHRWYFYPALTRDEVLLIKQWDSAGPLARSQGECGDASDAEAPCTFSFHSAFRDPKTPADAPDRWSIEVRCAVFYA
ncbi:MAG: CmcJ/NvfI family oxidoreductase [Myxococcales bacterium]|nr:CmcJ/NvfI family oxidoreductase [Myxococcales bacterium]MDD9969588.1 CmcJ/NvfI family oxidoreductase [Myxococcales bacterium]